MGYRVEGNSFEKIPRGTHLDCLFSLKMQFVQVLLLIAVLAVACLSQEIEEGVLVLTDDNFEKVSPALVLLEIQAPHMPCSSCIEQPDVAFSVEIAAHYVACKLAPLFSRYFSVLHCPLNVTNTLALPTPCVAFTNHQTLTYLITPA